MSSPKSTDYSKSFYEEKFEEYQKEASNLRSKTITFSIITVFSVILFFLGIVNYHFPFFTFKNVNFVTVLVGIVVTISSSIAFKNFLNLKIASENKLIYKQYGTLADRIYNELFSVKVLLKKGYFNTISENIYRRLKADLIYEPEDEIIHYLIVYHFLDKNREKITDFKNLLRVDTLISPLFSFQNSKKFKISGSNKG